VTTLFVSDLHLDDGRPGSTDLFLQFLSDEAAAAAALYILGDLFEYWLGDDVGTPTSRRVAEGISRIAGHGVPCYFMHGNRDFLVAEGYAESAGFSLLPEEHVVDLYGTPTLLLHGDSLCTDDVEYQKVRAHIRTPQWRDEFLSKPLAERVAFAEQSRLESERYKEAASMDIMDVNPDAVAAAFARHGVTRMIHGHTHRPAVHELALPGGRVRRIVLGDWYTQGSVLRVRPDGATLDVLPEPQRRTDNP
jgi:UDP-2,3-diacylglucosamine hydrolase